MTPSASEIIERVRARYAGCRTYEDEGSVTVGVRSHVLRKDPFRTVYARDRGLIFELTGPRVGPRIEQLLHGIAWLRSPPDEWCSLPTLDRLGPRLDVFEAMQQSSITPSALIVVPLLVPDVVRSTSELSTTAKVRRASLGSIDGYLLSSRQERSSIRIWVDASSWCIRKHEERIDVPRFEGAITTVWHPRIDHDIDPRRFDLTPAG